MIKVFDNKENICECCDNDSSILIDFNRLGGYDKY